MAKVLKNLWIVGWAHNPNEDDNRWEFVGLYDSEDKAVEICKDKHYFVAEVKRNETLQLREYFSNSYFPII